MKVERSIRADGVVVERRTYGPGDRVRRFTAAEGVGDCRVGAVLAERDAMRLDLAMIETTLAMVEDEEGNDRG